MRSSNRGASFHEEARAIAFSRRLLWLNVGLFGIYGLAYLLAPDLFAQLLTGTGFPNAALAIDVRAIYGGLPLGLTAFLWLSVRGGAESQRTGQLGCAIAYGCVALGRLIGMLVTKSPTAFMLVLLAAEALFSGLSWNAVVRLKADRTSVAQR